MTGIAGRCNRSGEMAERFKAPVLKTGEGSNLPWVRIPLSPPFRFRAQRENQEILTPGGGKPRLSGHGAALSLGRIRAGVRKGECDDDKDVPAGRPCAGAHGSPD